MARSKTTKTRTTLTYETLPALFTGICNAIRTKTGGTDPINHQDIPSVIETIGGGIDYTTINGGTAIAQNWTNQDFTAPADGLYFIIATQSNNTTVTNNITVNGSTPATLGYKSGVNGVNRVNLTIVELKQGDTVVQRYSGSVTGTYFYI